MAISIACISGKGGVGKTTTTINLAAALRADLGRDMLDGLREIPNLKVFESIIRYAVKLRESSPADVPVTSSAPTSEAVGAYRGLPEEIPVHG